ncbi:hypothetical protein ABEG18_26115 [Alsobacter sp. KACC 23698]|uniref:Uncharacterized protein n=1 Tax=Alsobacter sp. KACC 23698 TaxID=3149229 RepID=A0AAU7JG43_9HYPH
MDTIEKFVAELQENRSTLKHNFGSSDGLELRVKIRALLSAQSLISLYRYKSFFLDKRYLFPESELQNAEDLVRNIDALHSEFGGQESRKLDAERTIKIDETARALFERVEAHYAKLMSDEISRI